jgi:TolC family type I secretion outer membrane protein
MKRMLQLPRLPALAVILSLSGADFLASADPLSLQAFEKLALEHNPQVGISQSTVDAATAGKKTAYSQLWPHLDLQGSETSAPGGTLRSSGSSTTTAASLQLQQLLFDFGKTTAKAGAAARSLDAAKADQSGSVQDVILNARSAYFAYLLAQKVLNANQEALKQAEIHLDQAKRLFESGKQPKYAVTKAEVDAANARVSLIKAENGLSFARVQLENTAGVELKDGLVLSDSLNVNEPEVPLDEALKAALDNRPEMVSARAKAEAARLQWLSAKRALYPNLNAAGSAGWQKPDNSDWSRDWSVSINVTAPLFQGGGLAASAEQARAGQAQADKTAEAAAQNIRLEVQQRYLDKKAAYQQIAATIKLIDQAQQGLQLSQERYQAGLAASVEIIDAEQTLLNAVIGTAQAWSDYRVAHARLLRAMGNLRQ